MTIFSYRDPAVGLIPRFKVYTWSPLVTAWFGTGGIPLVYLDTQFGGELSPELYPKNVFISKRYWAIRCDLARYHV